MTATAKGLEGIVVADTELSEVDGERGRLTIRGRDVEELAAVASFEDACALLWGRPQDATANGLREALAAARTKAFDGLGTVGSALGSKHGMDALRAALAHLELEDGQDEAVTITGALAVYAAGWLRTRDGEAPVAPDPSLSHAADMLQMATGRAPTEEAVRALDAYLVTVIDHGFNASTFTARVVASTHSDAVSAVVAALGALKGPLHGGAPGPVLDMLDAIATPGGARPWLEAELAAGRRIMGVGHRVYRVRDPRAAVLERATKALATAGLATDRLALAAAVEETAVALLRERHPDRPLAANVEFYTAVLLDAVGVPREAFTTTFAVGRVAGWLAHVDEQRRSGRLIRPRARYTGPRCATSA